MISREDFKLIEEKPSELVNGLFYIFYYGGLRLSELCELKISDFDFQSRTMTFNRKGGYVHTLVIQKDELIFKNLKHYIAENEFNKIFLFKLKREAPTP